jgi:hypothetical protein
MAIEVVSDSRPFWVIKDEHGLRLVYGWSDPSQAGGWTVLLQVGVLHEGSLIRAALLLQALWCQDCGVVDGNQRSGGAEGDPD